MKDIIDRLRNIGYEPTVRGEAVAEIERLRAVIDKGGKAWLSLNPRVAWEGDLGDAMVAACEEIKRLRDRAFVLNELRESHVKKLDEIRGILNR